MKLSIVTTLYYSEPYIAEFYERITAVARRITDDYEIIFVNDCSPDDSLAAAVALQQRDSKVVVIDFARNFGHHKAIMTGLSYARGEYVFLIDSDLEEKPENLSTFWQELHASQNVDVIYGVQHKRKGGWFERITGSIFYRIFNMLTSVKVPENVLTCRLMKRDYVHALVSFKEQEIFLAGLWAATGFQQKPCVVEKLSHSATTYNLRKKLSILVNSLTSFSNKPLVYIFYLGFFMSFLSGIAILYIAGRKIFYGLAIAGWTSLFVSIWFVGGIIIFSLGVIGIYLSKIFIETKNRPYTIVKRVYGRDPS